MQPAAFCFVAVAAPKAMFLICILQLLVLSFTKFLIFAGKEGEQWKRPQCVCTGSQCIAVKWDYTHANEIMNSD